jgi:hypothetical protein
VIGFSVGPRSAGLGSTKCLTWFTLESHSHTPQSTIRQEPIRYSSALGPPALHGPVGADLTATAHQPLNH